MDSVPLYERSTENAFDTIAGVSGEVSAGKSGDVSDASRVGGGCWNCGGDHLLKECSEPRNHDRIR